MEARPGRRPPDRLPLLLPPSHLPPAARLDPSSCPWRGGRGGSRTRHSRHLRPSWSKAGHTSHLYSAVATVARPRSTTLQPRSPCRSAVPGPVRAAPPAPSRATPAAPGKWLRSIPSRSHCKHLWLMPASFLR